LWVIQPRNVKIQFFFKIYCGLYNPQCITDCTTRNVLRVVQHKKFFTLRVVEPAMCFKIFTLWVVDERHFGLFIMSKMEILKNYRDAGSRHGGAGRITLIFSIIH